MAAKWRVKNYSIFVRESREKFRLSTSQARILYSEMRKELGRPVFANDLQKHPRIAHAALQTVEKTTLKPEEEKRVLRELSDFIDDEEEFTEYGGAIDYTREET